MLNLHLVKTIVYNRHKTVTYYNVVLYTNMVWPHH